MSWNRGSRNLFLDSPPTYIMQVKRKWDGKKKSSMDEYEIYRSIEQFFREVKKAGVKFPLGRRSSFYKSENWGTTILASSLDTTPYYAIKKEDEDLVNMIIKGEGEWERVVELNRREVLALKGFGYPYKVKRTTTAWGETDLYWIIPGVMMPVDDVKIHILKNPWTFKIEPFNYDFLIIKSYDRWCDIMMTEDFGEDTEILSMIRAGVSPLRLAGILKRHGLSEIAEMIEKNEIVEKYGDRIDEIMHKVSRRYLERSSIFPIPESNPVGIVYLQSVWVTTAPPDEVIKRFVDDSRYIVVKTERDVVGDAEVFRARFGVWEVLEGKNGLKIVPPDCCRNKVPRKIMKSGSELVKMVVRDTRSRVKKKDSEILLEFTIYMIYSKPDKLGAFWFSF